MATTPARPERRDDDDPSRAQPDAPHGQDPRDVKGGHADLTRDDAARASATPRAGQAPPQDLSGGGSSNQTTGVGGDKDAV